jgi:glycyl-tRNA synthetase beta chain
MIMKCSDFLLEVGTEEIPARMLAKASADLESLVLGALGTAGLTFTGHESFFTPRRLAIAVFGIPEAQADRDEVMAGPSVSIAKAADGSWSPAAAGFARGKGKTADDLIEIDSPKGRIIALKISTPGRNTLDVLAESIPAALSAVKFPKAMRWADGNGPFVRPVHWICCVFGGAVVDFSFLRIKSGSLSNGHRFLGTGPFELESPAAYVEQLRGHHVIVRPAERVKIINKQMAHVEKQTGLTFISNESLFDEVANIIEEPHLITCNFDADFLRLPVEVLTTAMAAHQRYFAMQDAAGKLTRTFGVVCNNKARDMSGVARGNERVLAARLYDSRFFFEQDLAAGLEVMGTRLGERLFLKDAGTMHDKVRRVEKICAAIAEEVGLSATETTDLHRAATLCKSDLMSAMVCELPEVQGVMGSYYATAAGESPVVANAIRDHYLPKFAGDTLPGSDVCAVLAVADRLDSIATCFQVGAIPTGSRDPLALRRQAIALLRIIINSKRLNGLTIPGLLKMAADSRGIVSGAREAISDAVASVTGKNKKDSLTVEEFMAERFRGILTDEYGVTGDVANAVIPFMSGDCPASPADLAARAVAIREALADDSFRDFLDNVFKRVGNLMKKADEEMPHWRRLAGPEGLAEKIGHVFSGKEARNNLLDPTVDFTDMFDGPLEKELEICRVSGAGLAELSRKNRDYSGTLKVMASFAGPLAMFFGSGKEGVPVLLENDETLRVARLALLDRVLSQFNWFADFSRISTR